ncbi:unnamed protein product [Timema podura]|uniref:Secreted protein n=1 Tax=Timema podura TaxID=61482 RepID=A0ABN7PNM3_TIMPD|nr:unnamed protein product [Timema podura]
MRSSVIRTILEATSLTLLAGVEGVGSGVTSAAATAAAAVVVVVVVTAGGEEALGRWTPTSWRTVATPSSRETSKSSLKLNRIQRHFYEVEIEFPMSTTQSTQRYNTCCSGSFNYSAGTRRV